MGLYYRNHTNPEKVSHTATGLLIFQYVPCPPRLLASTFTSSVNHFIIFFVFQVMVSHVGYKAEKQDQLSPTNHACAGAVSGAVARAVLQPLDVLKIRFQVSSLYDTTS